MKSTEPDDQNLEQIGDTQLVEEAIALDAQQNTENMDGDAKKSQIYSSNNRLRHAGYLKYVSLVILTIQNAALGLSMRYVRTRDVVMFSSAAGDISVEVAYDGLFAVIVLKRKLKKWQWCALGLLAGGVALVQLSSAAKETKPTASLQEQSKVIGFSAALAACFISGFAGIYFEKVLKESDISVSIQTWKEGFISLFSASMEYSKHCLVKVRITLLRVPFIPSTKATAAASARSEKHHVFVEYRREVEVPDYQQKILKTPAIPLAGMDAECSAEFTFVTFCRGYVSFKDPASDLLKGFDGFVWYLVILQAAGGLIVAVVVKYADNILKGFATSVAIIISCVASMYIFDFHLTVQFSVGAMLVMGSIFLYGYVPKKKEPRTSLSV